MRLLWLIPLAPAAGGALNAIGGRWLGRVRSGTVALTAMAVATVASAWAVAGLFAQPGSARVLDSALGPWISSMPLASAGGIGLFSVSWTARLDPLSSIAVLAVAIGGLLMHLYAIARVPDSTPLLLSRLSLFVSCLLLLALGANFLVLYAGWMGAALCALVLPGSLRGAPKDSGARQTASILNRTGDGSLLAAMLLAFFVFGTLDFREIATLAGSMPRETAAFGALSPICILLLGAAAARSAAVPAELSRSGETEAHARVLRRAQAVAMAAASLYLLARTFVLFDRAPFAWVVAAVAAAVLVAGYLFMRRTGR